MNCHCVCRPVIPALGLEERGEQIFGSPGDDEIRLEISNKVSDYAIQDYRHDQPRDDRGRFTKADGNGRIQSMEDVYSNLNEEWHDMGLIQGESRLMKPKRIEIVDMAAHAVQRFEDRQATQEMAQSYIDNALVMIQESKDKFEFIAHNGSSVILEYGKLLTVIPKEFFTEKQKRKLEVIMKWLLQK